MKDERERMVYEIQKKYGFSSTDVLSVMLQVPRHEFIDGKYRDIAYEDKPVSIGFGQTMSQPYTVAFMTDLLELTGNEKVLEVGTGSGYQAAVLSKLAREVYSLEIIPELAKKAAENLNRLGFNNVFVKEGSGESGWPESSPYDAVVITAGVREKVPQSLIDQLKVEGLMVVPIGPRNLQTMTRIRKLKHGIEKELFQKFVFVPFVES